MHRPNFLPGILFDVWFYPDGRARQRIKISVTTDPELWRGEVGKLKLDALVRERFEGRLIDACVRGVGHPGASLRVTSRPDEEEVVVIRWS